MENSEQRRAEPEDRSDYAPEKITNDEGKLIRYKGRFSVITSIMNGREPTSLLQFYQQHSDEIVNYSDKFSLFERAEKAAKQFDYDANETRTFLKKLDEELASEDEEKSTELREERISAFINDTRDEITRLEKKLGKHEEQTDGHFS